MPRVRSRPQRWQNYMNRASNCFHNNLILQIYSPVTTGCLQTSKVSHRKRDLAPMKKWYWKLRRILRPMKNCFKKKHRIVREALKSVYHPRRRLCWWIESDLPKICCFVFINGSEDLGSIPGRVIPKTLEMVHDTSLLNTQQYKVRIERKVEQSRERCTALPYTLV